MKMRTFIGLCAALAFAAGSTTVHAVKIVESVSSNPADGEDSVSYAKEMLLSTATTKATDDDDETTYYDIGVDATTLVVSAPADIAKSNGDTGFYVSFGLEGLVFQADLANNSLNPTGSFTLIAGGSEGDRTATFRGTSAAAIGKNDAIALEASFAISAAGSGTIARTVTNQALEDIPGVEVDSSMTHTGTGIIKAVSALKEMAMAMSPTATVEHSFRSFGGAATATVGSLRVTFEEEIRQASGGNVGTNVDDLTQIINDGETDNVPNSTVSFMGDFSFATKVFLHGDNDCGASPPVVTEMAPIHNRCGRG